MEQDKTHHVVINHEDFIKLEECKKELIKHFPVYKDIKISNKFILNKIINYFLER